MLRAAARPTAPALGGACRATAAATAGGECMEDGDGYRRSDSPTPTPTPPLTALA